MSEPLAEHELVILTRDLPDEGLWAGDVAVVLLAHPGRDGTPPGYTVEVTTVTGETVAVVAVAVRPAAEHDVRHARAVAPRAQRLAARHRNLVVVGDPRQALCGWRGADVRFLLRMRADFPDALLLRLGRNLRSTGRIVALANALGATLGEYAPLRTDDPPGRQARRVVAADEHAEAAYVAAEVERLRAERAIGGHGEVAVLYPWAGLRRNGRSPGCWAGSACRATGHGRAG